MAVGLAITRHDENAEDLRRLARLCRNVAQARRLLAIALVMEGHSRTDAATAAGMDRQSLRDWLTVSMRRARTACATSPGAVARPV